MVRKRKRKRIGLTERLVVPAAQTPNQSWSMDYVAAGLIDGRKLRALMVVDDFTRECLAIEVDTSLPGSRVVAVLERLRDLRGLLSSITVDPGPEFEGQVLDAWAYKRNVRLAFIRPGKPVDNCYVESFKRALARRMPDLACSTRARRSKPGGSNTTPSARTALLTIKHPKSSERRTLLGVPPIPCAKSLKTPYL